MNETAQLPFGHEPLATGVEQGAGTAAPVGGAAGPKARKRIGAGGLIACMLAAGVLGGGTVAGATTFLNASSPVASTSQTAEFTPVIVNNPDSVNAVTAAAQKATPSVVTISATTADSGGTGSGIILDADGHILTNMHVVTLDGEAAGAVIEVRTSDGSVYPGTVVGTDALADLAVVKIDAEGLIPASLGDSAKVNVGDTAIAIGAPLGLSGTVTDGIVSAANRAIETASSAASTTPSRGRYATAAQASVSMNVIQTDAAINPGNSGGALVNTKGEVIGVNVAIATADSTSSASTSGNIGVGFSIPINEASRVAQEIIADGSATHGQLGLSVQDMASGTSSGFTTGAESSAVTPGSGAASAGLKAGDVITGLAGRSITDASELTAAAHEHAAGTTVKVTYQRGGKELSTDVVLGSATAG